MNYRRAHYVSGQAGVVQRRTRFAGDSIAKRAAELRAATEGVKLWKPQLFRRAELQLGQNVAFRGGP
jgi:hypothetical protein